MARPHLAIWTVLAAIGCSGKQTSSTRHGSCVEFEPYSGYTTCLLSEPQTDPTRTAPQVLARAAATAPGPSADLRTSFLDGCLEVHDQGNCSWCVPHVVTAALEAELCRELSTGSLSPPHLWQLGHGGEATDCDQGWLAEHAVEAAEAQLLVSSSVWPFVDDDDVMNAARPEQATLEAAGWLGAAGYRELWNRDHPGIKSALAEGHPVMIAVAVIRDAGWQDDGIAPGVVVAPPSGGTCECEDPACDEEYCIEGFHEILLVGYRDDDASGATGTFEFLNSWGTGFGIGGYGTISYEGALASGIGQAHSLTGLRRGASNMVTVPAGMFMMGDPGCRDGAAADDCPYHPVDVAVFDIDVTEVTAAEYQKCVDAGACDVPPGTTRVEPDPDASYVFYDPVGHPDLPAVPISWEMAAAYCAHVGKRLPTEAEWEKAARGVDDRLFPWGDADPTCTLAVIDETGDAPGCGVSPPYLAEVGSKPAGASPYGVLDMAGNVREWVADWYDPDYYASSPRADPAGPGAEVDSDDCVVSCGRVIRGGGYDTEADKHVIRGHHREYINPWLTAAGFRCAR